MLVQYSLHVQVKLVNQLALILSMACFDLPCLKHCQRTQDLLMPGNVFVTSQWLYRSPSNEHLKLNLQKSNQSTKKSEIKNTMMSNLSMK